MNRTICSMLHLRVTSSGHIKILNLETNVNRGYVVIPLNLTAINSPKQFLATFFIEDIISPYVVWDFTNWVNIPPPEYSISESPSSINSRPGESSIIELKIDQVGLPTRVQPVVNFFPENKYPDVISIDIRPNQTSILRQVISCPVRFRTFLLCIQHYI